MRVSPTRSLAPPDPPAWTGISPNAGSQIDFAGALTFLPWLLMSIPVLVLGLRGLSQVSRSVVWWRVAWACAVGAGVALAVLIVTSFRFPPAFHQLGAGSELERNRHRGRVPAARGHHVAHDVVAHDQASSQPGILDRKWWKQLIMEICTEGKRSDRPYHPLTFLSLPSGTSVRADLAR